MKIYGVTGWKNCGKTGLMEGLVAEVTSRGYRVSTVKHAHHSFDVDQSGRDSYRHREAGAQEVLLISGSRWALMHELRGAEEPPLAEMLTKLSDVDLVLVEGYKREPHPKIETHRAAAGQPLIATADQTIRALASDQPAEAHGDLGRPIFDLNDHDAIATFILQDLGLMPT
ncbi:molybdopterin-guanine dinucleotide biosynthesis protein B [Thalassobius sp. Cn5-15]|uniref:molybdopterin-guanine dinucleotide biosynthesis protein B n=1 Tax=Thalassobius sp. Cn5-15 TaxID=2917763 RepID=UPI001EF2421C|nr:molybdopterin-guanine dinucleotide biosynthesis protein B [Thalassobius sp. Cn5-15]MCG7494265.1 molybdopterin-guanine dinucleotide biosynthesis protein B [Thalassobius sp. Cn5-15]